MVNATETNRPVVTRIAPSPTGFMHIGTARTALFNWLYARGRGGRFMLRIEDTDKSRQNDAAAQAILDGLTWLGLDWDGDMVSQASRADRHAEVAREMLSAGTAYKCFATQEEIEASREAARAEGRSTLYRSPWRDADPSTHPDAPYAIRVKAPQDGETVIHDQVQGDVTVRNSELDDMVVLRSDGTPTYMLAVVVDDHDMGVTHVIRGDDHLMNAARQAIVYTAMGWDEPVQAHIPLIHGEDGKKLSKRHGALGIEDYVAMGFPAPAMRNYLARLGWSHGDDELFTTDQATEWFDLPGIGRSPARLDLKKLENVSRHHLSIMTEEEIVTGLRAYLAAAGKAPLTEEDTLRSALPCIQNAKTYADLMDKAHFALTSRPIQPEPKAQKALTPEAIALLHDLTPHLQNANWSRDTLEVEAARIAEHHGVGLGKIAAPLRASLAGRTATPSVFDMMVVLGREETLLRIEDSIGGDRTAAAV